MYHNKQLLATNLYETLDDLILTDEKGTVSIDKLLSPQQKYDMIMHIMNGLPLTDFERVLDFNNQIEIPKETTHIVDEMTETVALFTNLLEKVFALGRTFKFSTYYMYCIQTALLERTEKQNLQPDTATILKTLVEIMFANYTAVNVLNLTDALSEAVEEVHYSNLTKIIPKDALALSTIKESVEKLVKEGKHIITKDVTTGYIITDSDSGSVLEPNTYVKPDLQTLINKHFKS